MQGNYFTVFTASAHPAICAAPRQLQQIVDAVQPGIILPYFSPGAFSLHDLVVRLVKKFAPVQVSLATYALRELPSRQLIMCIKDGLIASLDMVLDYKAMVRAPEVVEFTKLNFTRVVLKPMHAKICVIEAAGISLVIVGSQNFTVNPKTEAGVIICDAAAAQIGRAHV